MITDEEYAALRLLHKTGWVSFRPLGDTTRISAIATPRKASIALVGYGTLLAELSPFDAEQLGRDLVDLAEDVIADPQYPG